MYAKFTTPYEHVELYFGGAGDTLPVVFRAAASQPTQKHRGNLPHVSLAPLGSLPLVHGVHVVPPVEISLGPQFVQVGGLVVSFVPVGHAAHDNTNMAVHVSKQVSVWLEPGELHVVVCALGTCVDNQSTNGGVHVT